MRCSRRASAESPDKWEYYHDAGFVEYWWRRDARAAADWFLRGVETPAAPNWLQPLAASVLAEGGDQLAARVLWTQMAQTAEQEWMRQTARTRLHQLDAEAVIEQLQPIVNSFYDTSQSIPDRLGRDDSSWTRQGRPTRPDRRSLHAGSGIGSGGRRDATHLSIPCGAAAGERRVIPSWMLPLCCSAVRGLHRKLSERLHLPAAARRVGCVAGIAVHVVRSRALVVRQLSRS